MYKKKTSGVYKIENIVNGKCYIGSSCNIEHRWAGHRYGLRKNNHGNSYLQRAWNKYGESNFIFKIIEMCDSSLLQDREQYWIDYYNSASRDNGYNLCPKAYTKNGYKLSDETKKKMSDSMHKRWSNKGFKENAKIYGLTKKRLQDHGLEGFITGNKLTKEDAIEIFNRQDEDVDILAQKYGVTTCAIHDIWKGKTWYLYTHKNYVKTHTNLTKESVLNIVNEYNNGVSIEDIANKYNTEIYNVRNILRGRTWTNVTKIKPNQLPRKSQAFPLYQIDNNRIINYYKSSDIASDKTGYDARSIRRACKEHIAYKGFIWMYEKEYSELIETSKDPLLLCSNE